MNTCPWLIEVASGNPEPDSYADTVRIVECGAPVTVNEYGSWRCEYGHWHTSVDDPAYSEAALAMWEREVERWEFV
jgi:hypothetical protein